MLYLESFGNPRKFARIARRVANKKPVLAVKSGRSAAGSRAAQSHTAALASSERATAALFQQTGIVRAETLEELFDVASVLASQPLAAGNHVAVVTNAGGPAILCVDACESHGLELAAFAAETRDSLRAVLPSTAAVNNPVDMESPPRPLSIIVPSSSAFCAMRPLIRPSLSTLRLQSQRLHLSLLPCVTRSRSCATSTVSGNLSFFVRWLGPRLLLLPTWRRAKLSPPISRGFLSSVFPNRLLWRSRVPPRTRLGDAVPRVRYHSSEIGCCRSPRDRAGSDER